MATDAQIRRNAQDAAIRIDASRMGAGIEQDVSDKVAQVKRCAPSRRPTSPGSADR